MLARKPVLPSPAQARLIARLWGDNRKISVPKSRWQPIDATVEACIERGWLCSLKGHYKLRQNGFEFETYTITNDAVDALERFLRSERATNRLRPNTGFDGQEAGAT